MRAGDQTTPRRRGGSIQQRRIVRNEKGGTGRLRRRSVGEYIEGRNQKSCSIGLSSFSSLRWSRPCSDLLAFASASAGIGRVLFGIFLVLFLLSLVTQLIYS